jgi:hypothetical protein
MRQNAIHQKLPFAAFSALHHPSFFTRSKLRNIEDGFSLDLFNRLLALSVVHCVQPEFVAITCLFFLFPFLRTAIFLNLIEGFVSSFQVFLDQGSQEGGFVSPIIHHHLILSSFLLGRLTNFLKLGFLLICQTMVINIEQLVLVHELTNARVHPYPVLTVLPAAALLAGHKLHWRSKFRDIKIPLFV